MQKTYVSDLLFQSRNWRFRTVRPPFLLLFVPCAEVQKPVFVTYLRPDCFHFFASAHSPSDAFLSPCRMPFSAFSALRGLRQNIAGGSEVALHQAFILRTIFTEASVNILQSLWSNATAALEYCSDGLGAMLQQPRRNLTGRQRNGRKGRAVWLEVPYEAVWD